jgi:hypothetical protein
MIEAFLSSAVEAVFTLVWKFILGQSLSSSRHP